MGPLQVDMDPVRLAVACMALSLHNQTLRSQVAKLEELSALLSEENALLRSRRSNDLAMMSNALKEIHTEAARIWEAGSGLPDCALIADIASAVLTKEAPSHG